jgi:nucleoid DNA-binding protein
MAVKKRAPKKSVSKKTIAKAPVKRTVTKKKVAPKKKAAAKSPAATRKKLTSISAKQTKTQIIQAIAEDTELTRKQVSEVFDSLAELIQRNMQRRGSGEFTIPQTGVKIRRVRKPARKARMGRNPATGETIKIAAKPASTVIKVAALKALKDTIN